MSAAHSLTIRTLGQQTVLVDGAPVQWPSQAARDLFYLLLSDPRGQTKDAMTEVLWESATAKEGSDNLKVARYRMRRALHDPEVVVVQDGRHTLSAEYYHNADHTLFQSRLAQAKSAATREQQVSYLYQALSLYQGDYLPDQAALWAEETRDALRAASVRARLDLASLHCDAVECQAAVQNLARGLSADHLVSERYHRDLMTCLCTLERPDHALAHYRHLLTFIQREVGDSLAQDTVELADAIRNGRKHVANHIGTYLPCPRRLLNGGWHVDTRAPRRFDPDLWETELTRGRHLLTLARTLGAAQTWAVLAERVQRALGTRLQHPYLRLIQNTPQLRRPQAAHSGLGGPNWPAPISQALETALNRQLSQAPADDSSTVELDSGAEVDVMVIRGHAYQPLGWLCVVRPTGVPTLAPDDMEYLARVVGLLRYVLSQPRWMALISAAAVQPPLPRGASGGG